MSMQQVKDYICNNIDALRGRYICVSNVHTTVMSHDDESYCNVQNSAALRLPDGKPLSIVAKHRGFEDAVRVTGPDLMGELLQMRVRISSDITFTEVHRRLLIRLRKS